MTITKANIQQMQELVVGMRRDGVLINFQNGWSSRDAGGLFGPWVGGVIHHDASTIKAGTWGALGIIIAGRRGSNPVPGPLAQLQIARGDRPMATVVTAGRANHAGRGGPYGIVPIHSGNRWLVGAEVANDGIDEPYSSATLHVIESFGYHAARLSEPETSVSYVIGHNEWAAYPTAHLDSATSKATGRKSDPRYNMNWMRRLVSTHNTGIPEDDMSQADVMAALQAFFHATDINVPEGQRNNDSFIINLTEMSQIGYNRDNEEVVALRALSVMSQKEAERDNEAAAALQGLAGIVTNTKEVVLTLATAVNTAGMTPEGVAALAAQLAPLLPQVDENELALALGQRLVNG